MISIGVHSMFALFRGDSANCSYLLSRFLRLSVEVTARTRTLCCRSYHLPTDRGVSSDQITGGIHNVTGLLINIRVIFHIIYFLLHIYPCSDIIERYISILQKYLRQITPLNVRLLNSNHVLSRKKSVTFWSITGSLCSLSTMVLTLQSMVLANVLISVDDFVLLLLICLQVFCLFHTNWCGCCCW